MRARQFAPAKINLTLEVAPPRADGMHELQSAVVFADVGDWVSAERARDATFHVSGPFHRTLISEPSNLVQRAVEAFVAEGGEDIIAALTLEKNLPVASGIGGGSSDAAATLRALNLLAERPLDEAALLRAAARLGADVPVCVGARSAWMNGVGDKLASMVAPMLHAVLVNPGRPLRTQSVFAMFDEMLPRREFVPRPAPVWHSADEAIGEIEGIGNDLEQPATAMMPEIGTIAKLLRADGRVAYAGLSGSGATLFALTETSDAAQALAADFTSRSREWWVAATRLGALDASNLRG